MPEGAKKSRTFRRVNVKTPGGKTILSYRKRKPSKAKCSNCGKVLSGVPRARDYKIQNMAKTEKRPSRAYGGNMCSKCSRDLIKEKARSLK